MPNYRVNDDAVRQARMLIHEAVEKAFDELLKHLDEKRDA